MKQTILLTAIVMLFTACGTRNVVTQDGNNTDISSSAAASTTAFVRSVNQNNLKNDALTAKLSMDLTVGTKNVGLTGSLKMKRDDVIQLSLVLLFVEVARIEFSPKDVLIIDRVRKQYVRASYDEVDFLAKAGLNYYSLQALFWHELFQPGLSSEKVKPERFQMASAGNHTILSVTDAPKLNYEFLVNQQNHLIDRLTVEGKTPSDRGKFVWRYVDFTDVAGKSFPKKMNLNVSGLNKDIQASLELSGIGTDSKWNAHTTPSEKYRQRTASEVLKNLF